jgi:hypothetical protein
VVTDFACFYQHITSRMRDPALVEMVGKNTFRARIVPVMPNANLRVQIRYVQALPMPEGRATYTLPLRTGKTERLESATVDVTEAPNPGGKMKKTHRRTGTNHERGGHRAAFTDTSYWASADLYIAVPATPLRASLLRPLPVAGTASSRSHWTPDSV